MPGRWLAGAEPDPDGHAGAPLRAVGRRRGSPVGLTHPDQRGADAFSLVFDTAAPRCGHRNTRLPAGRAAWRQRRLPAATGPPGSATRRPTQQSDWSLGLPGRGARICSGRHPAAPAAAARPARHVAVLRLAATGSGRRRRTPCGRLSGRLRTRLSRCSGGRAGTRPRSRSCRPWPGRIRAGAVPRARSGAGGPRRERLG